MTNHVTACLITRGDVDLDPILDSLIFDDVIVWDGSKRPADFKVYSRYLLTLEAECSVVYLQDDDCIVPPSTQQALVDAYEPGVMVANWGHGGTPDGYEDVPLVHGGAIVDRFLPTRALSRYLERWPLDDDFMYEADMVAGVLYPEFRYLRLPYEIRDVAYNGRRMADQPWQRDLKYKITQRARAIRDESLVAA